jgi:hypothetical protein
VVAGNKAVSKEVPVEQQVSICAGPQA